MRNSFSEEAKIDEQKLNLPIILQELGYLHRVTLNSSMISLDDIFSSMWIISRADTLIKCALIRCSGFLFNLFRQEQLGFVVYNVKCQLHSIVLYLRELQKHFANFLDDVELSVQAMLLAPMQGTNVDPLLANNFATWWNNTTHAAQNAEQKQNQMQPGGPGKKSG